MGDAITEAKFRRELEKVFSDKGPIAHARDFKTYYSAFSKEYEEIIKIILDAKDVDGLSRLMRAYMSLYEQYRENKDNVQFYRSDQVFLILVEQSGNIPVGKRDLFEDYATRIEGSDKDHSLRKRFLDLSDTFQSQVTDAIKSVRKKRQTGKSILDILKDEYVKY